MTAETGRAIPLAGPLALLVPDRRQTLLLRGALHPPEGARDAIETWQAETPAPARELGTGAAGGQLLAPLIARNMADGGARLDARLQTYLRTALVREELRARALRRICGETRDALTAAGILPVLLRGLAASETVYPEPTLRHTHDLDLLVGADSLGEAVRALGGAGFRADPSAAAPPGTRLFVHASGLPLALHDELFRAPLHRRKPESMLARARTVPCLGGPLRLLAPADQLLHVLVHAAGAGSRASLLWACDAWLTIRAERALDWDTLVAEATARRAALPVAILLRYLATELEAPVPPATLDALDRAAGAATRVEREVALWGAWGVPGVRLSRALARAAGPVERAFLLRWRLLPAPDALMAAGRVPPGPALVSFYVGRPWRVLTRRLERLAPAAHPRGVARS